MGACVHPYAVASYSEAAHVEERGAFVKDLFEELLKRSQLFRRIYRLAYPKSYCDTTSLIICAQGPFNDRLRCF
jgi:hypothetical protein